MSYVIVKCDIGLYSVWRHRFEIRMLVSCVESGSLLKIIWHKWVLCIAIQRRLFCLCGWISSLPRCTSSHHVFWKSSTNMHCKRIKTKKDDISNVDYFCLLLFRGKNGKHFSAIRTISRFDNYKILTFVGSNIPANF